MAGSLYFGYDYTITIMLVSERDQEGFYGTVRS